MVDLSGSFTVPVSQQVPGQITVYDWYKCRMLVNKQNVGGIITMTCTRSADISAGVATITVFDPTKSVANSLNAGDEVEIFLAETSPLTYANKVWGGFLESKEFNVTKKAILTITAKEYTQNLIIQITGATAVSNQNSFSGVEPGVAIQDIMAAYQVEFTTANVITGTSSLLSTSYLNKSIFDAVSSICTQFNYVFYVNLVKDLVVRPTTTIVPTPASDYLTYGQNLSSLVEKNNKEQLCNDVIVYGGGGAVSNGGAAIVNQTSINSYGRSAKRLTIPNLTTNTDCTNYANAYIAAYAIPIQEFTTTSRFVAFSEPLEYIQLNSGPSRINGAYQIREITQTYSSKGIVTEMTLNQKISDATILLGQLTARVNAIETATLA